MVSKNLILQKNDDWYSLSDTKQPARVHFIPDLNRLSDNSISGQKYVKTKMYKAFKSKKEEIEYYSE